MDQMPSHQQHTSRPSSSIFLIINAIAFILFVGILAVTLLNKSWMKFSCANISYYVILGLFLTWLTWMWSFLKENSGGWKVFFKAHWKGVVFALLLASIIFVSVPKYFRVLSDETNLLSVTKSMTFNKKVGNITEGRQFFYMFWEENAATEKRPFLFTFVTSLAHTFLGYRVENVFILNFFALWAVLLMLYLIIRASLGVMWAFAAMVLVSAQPVIALSATSGSYEVFNLAFILLSFWSLRYFLGKPSYNSFAFLSLNLIMLANIRYESIIFFVVVMLMLLITGYIRVQFWKQSLIFAVMPFFFLSLIWQRFVMLGVADPNLPDGNWAKAFGFDSFMKNTLAFIKDILDVSANSGYAGAINTLGIIAVLYFVVKLLIGHKDLSKRASLLLGTSIVGVFVVFFLVLSYKIDPHPMNGRVHFPILVALSVLPVYFIAEVLRNAQRFAKLALIVSLGLFIFYHPVAVEDRLSNTLLSVRDYRYELEFFQKLGDKKILIICGRPGQFIPYGYGAISFSTANQDKANTIEQYKNHLYTKIYVVQEVLYVTKQPEETNAVAPDYRLRVVSELQAGPTYFIRISEVIPPDNP